MFHMHPRCCRVSSLNCNRRIWSAGPIGFGRHIFASALRWDPEKIGEDLSHFAVCTCPLKMMSWYVWSFFFATKPLQFQLDICWWKRIWNPRKTTEHLIKKKQCVGAVPSTFKWVQWFGQMMLEATHSSLVFMSLAILRLRQNMSHPICPMARTLPMAPFQQSSAQVLGWGRLHDTIQIRRNDHESSFELKQLFLLPSHLFGASGWEKTTKKQDQHHVQFLWLLLCFFLFFFSLSLSLFYIMFETLRHIISSSIYHYDHKYLHVYIYI